MRLSLERIEGDERYAYATGRIRALQKRLVDGAVIRRMLEAPDALSAYRILQETAYAIHMGEAGLGDYERVLEAGLADAYEVIRGLAPDRSLPDILSRRYDLHNAKVIIKGEATGRRYAHLLSPLAGLDTGVTAAAWRERDWRQLPDWLGRLLRQAATMLDGGGDLYQVDLMLDGAWYEGLLEWAESRDSDYLRSWLTARIDVLNIMSLLRALASGWPREKWRRLFLPGGSLDSRRLENLYDLSPEQAAASMTGTDYRREIEAGLEGYREHGSLVYMEASFEVRLLADLESERYVTFGHQPLLAYILYKEAEVRTLRTIIIGKLNDLGHDLIHIRLRGLYV